MPAEPVSPGLPQLARLDKRINLLRKCNALHATGAGKTLTLSGCRRSGAGKTRVPPANAMR
jgi:hypothetical protein